ncbi:hypothetical protein [Rhizobium sp. RAF56]|jgi:hypothetical protein|uniref:hypothetical protein n=1 Tax=Rhizobium sp. RAF56 TaxID=3233062 RepID=UPI003F97831B
MTTNETAYDRLRSGKVAANLGFSDAVTAQAGQRFLDAYHRFDDELDEMVAKKLAKSSAAYATLTAGMKGMKKDLEDIVDDIEAMVDTANAALKIAKIFLQIVPML